MGFFSRLFQSSANKTEDNQDNEYVEYLMRELEKAKDGSGAALEAERQRAAELQKAMEQEQAEKEQLKEQLQQQTAQLEEKLQQQTALLEEKLQQQRIELEALSQKQGEGLEQNSAESQKMAELEEKLKAYEAAYPNVITYLAQAKKDADEVLSKAEQEAQVYQMEAEQKLRKRERENQVKFESAKYKIREYLDTLNKVQGALIQNYNDLGKLIEKMPIRVEDVFSEEPFELLPEEIEKEKKDETAQ